MRTRRLVGFTTATGFLIAGLWCGCSSFSSADAPNGSGQEAGGDGADGADSASDGGGAVETSRGCAAIDATKCFDFDDVPGAASGWSTFMYHDAPEPTLSANGFSPPNAARFAIAEHDAGVDQPPYTALIENDPGPPTRMQARVLVDLAPADERGFLLEYVLGVNAQNSVALSYACVKTSCGLSVQVFTTAGDAGLQVSQLDCAVFARGEWAEVELAIDSLPADGGAASADAGVIARCTVNGATVMTTTPPFDVGSPYWQVGLGDENLAPGPLGGQVVYFDDVAFR